jgi:hypothetical protein
MEQTFEITKAQLIEAFRKWNEEYENDPKSFQDELGDPQKDAEKQAAYLLKKLNENVNT